MSPLSPAHVGLVVLAQKHPRSIQGRRGWLPTEQRLRSLLLPPHPQDPASPMEGYMAMGCVTPCHWHALGSKQRAQPGGRAKRHVPDPAPTSAISTSLPSSHSTVWEQTGLPLPGLGTLQKVTRAGCGAVSWLQNRGFWFLRAQHSSLWPEGRAEAELGAGGDSTRL